MADYDYAKAKQIIESNADKIESASIGMHEDWLSTAEDVYCDGAFRLDLTNEDLPIGGIKGSYWATPVLELEYKDGSKVTIDCAKGERTGSKPSLSLLGVISGPMQQERELIKVVSEESR